MFRLTHLLQELVTPSEIKPHRDLPGPVVIWNLIRRCNLTCKHCYSISADKDFAGELSTAEAITVMQDLRAFQVPVLILSGGEPLLRPDIFELSAAAKALGFYVGLSTNGTLIDAAMAQKIGAIGYDYVGISLDGLGPTHDRFRRKEGAFDASLNALRICRDLGMKVGMRYTLTQENAHDLPGLLDLMETERIDKFYLSHLNYAGRGNKNRKTDAHFQTTRQAMDRLIDRCWTGIQAGRPREFVTGNNDADGIYLLRWVERNFPEKAAHIRGKLRQWGGNASGVNIANIDNLGVVHPDTMWWNYPLGSVRERPFSQIWQDTRDPVMAGLKQRPRQVEGRCAACAHFDLCGGNTRVRAWQTSGNLWAEDPGCYLDDSELGIPS